LVLGFRSRVDRKRRLAGTKTRVFEQRGNRARLGDGRDGQHDEEVGLRRRLERLALCARKGHLDATPAEPLQNLGLGQAFADHSNAVDPRSMNGEHRALGEIQSSNRDVVCGALDVFGHYEGSDFRHGSGLT
jgi:hypothetical protein